MSERRLDADVLASLGRRTFVSQNGLVAVLSELKALGELDFSTSRRAIKRARDEDVNLSTSAGHLVQIKQLQLQQPSETVDATVVHPGILIPYLVENCHHFAKFMFDRLAENPCSAQSPWRVVLYSDEITMGNVLKHDNRRKVQAVYWTFAEFGSDFLGSEHAWFVLCTLRSKTVSRLRGGMSELMKELLHLFIDPRSHLQAGVLLRSANASAILFGSLSIMVSDESALKHTWSVKGASGSLCCMLCRNVVSSCGSLHLSDASSTLVSIKELDSSKFIPQTRASLREAVLLLDEQVVTLGSDAFKKLQQCLGINYTPTGLLWCQTLSNVIDPAVMTMYDWMHVFLVSGIFHVEVNLLLSALSRNGFTQDRLHDYVTKCEWPSRLAGKSASGRMVFAKKFGSGDFKCSASDCLSIYKVIRLYLMVVVTPAGINEELKHACDNYFLLCRVLDSLAAIIKRRVEASDLMNAILDYFNHFKRTYTDSEWIPKFHLALHLPAQLSHHKCLIACFTQERKHKEIKRYGEQVSNTSQSFEKGVLESVLHLHLRVLQDSDTYPSQEPRLVDARLASVSLTAVLHGALQSQGEIRCSRTVMFGSMKQCSISDVIIFEANGSPNVGEVWFHAQVEGTVYTCVSLWESAGRNQFMIRAHPELILTSNIKDTCIYRRSGDIAIVAP